MIPPLPKYCIQFVLICLPYLVTPLKSSEDAPMSSGQSSLIPKISRSREGPRTMKERTPYQRNNVREAEIHYQEFLYGHSRGDPYAMTKLQFANRRGPTSRS